MTPITSPLVNTENLQVFANNLRYEFNKITDALFIENLIEAIKTHPGADKSCVNRWLLAAFDFPADYEKYNCFDIYNKSFYYQIIEKIAD